METAMWGICEGRVLGAVISKCGVDGASMPRTTIVSCRYIEIPPLFECVVRADGEV